MFDTDFELLGFKISDFTNAIYSHLKWKEADFLQTNFWLWQIYWYQENSHPENSHPEHSHPCF